METYLRAIPRDFFNEAKLLKCMGQLALHVLNRTTPENVNIEIEDNDAPFQIELTDCGHLYVANYSTTINQIPVLFKTNYNSKSAYPMLCQYKDCDYPVFTDQGYFTDEFKNIADELAKMSI